MRKADTLTKDQRWRVADLLAEDRLEAINKLCKEVKPKKTIYSVCVKRILDIIISVIALVVLLPLNLLFAIITFIDVGRPIFFTQKRVGKDGKIFSIIKFRNMKVLYNERGELLPGDMRVTEFGRFMRKSSFDELLNFWSILKGDMSIIGPRPLVPEYTHRYNKRHKMRLAVKPGLECPPRGDVDHVWDWQEQFENDVWYVENISFMTDLHMIKQLIKFALDKKNAEARAMVQRGIFMGYSEEGRAINMDLVPDKYFDKVISENECNTHMEIR